MAHPLFKATEEIRALRGKIVEQQIYSTEKDEAMHDYVNERISLWNGAIRATNGPRRGETQEAYNARIRSNAQK